MCPPHPVQRFVTRQGAPPQTPVGVPACVHHTQYSAPWPHRELHRRPQCASSTPNTALRCPTGSSTEGRMRPPHP
eukprot:8757619-Pyramimonas_sp.AAC.1